MKPLTFFIGIVPILSFPDKNEQRNGHEKRSCNTSHCQSNDCTCVNIKETLKALLHYAIFGAIYLATSSIAVAQTGLLHCAMGLPATRKTASSQMTSSCKCLIIDQFQFYQPKSECLKG